ncbi:MAG: glutathione S-transferase family protein [Actinomycetota bacterium]|nr:glutathione S-transferase family protein [Actinomycetota bacterium]
MIRLYRAPFSTNVERVALALAHKGLEVESVVISYEDRTPVEEVSGQGLVPVIDDDGEVVADSARILSYLEERYPKPPLFPSDPARRAEAEIFIDWFNEVWKSAPNSIESELESEQPAHDVIAAEGERMREALGLFERMLHGRDFLIGDRVSAADFAAFPFLKYARRRDSADEEPFHRILEAHQRLGEGDHPRLAAWIDRVDELPRV